MLSQINVLILRNQKSPNQPMFLTIVYILAFLVTVNFALLFFSCNKTTKKEPTQKHKPVQLKKEPTTQSVPSHLSRVAS